MAERKIPATVHVQLVMRSISLFEWMRRVIERALTEISLSAMTT